jgi:hypothetical protein
MAERDFLAATRERVVVFDGGMGATLEQFELTQEDYGGLQGKCHEALVLNRPDVIEGVHTSMLEAGAEVVETVACEDGATASRRCPAARCHAPRRAALGLGVWSLAVVIGDIDRNQRASRVVVVPTHLVLV